MFAICIANGDGIVSDEYVVEQLSNFSKSVEELKEAQGALVREVEKHIYSQVSERDKVSEFIEFVSENIQLQHGLIAVMRGDPRALEQLKKDLPLPKGRNMDDSNLIASKVEGLANKIGELSAKIGAEDRVAAAKSEAMKAIWESELKATNQVMASSLKSATEAMATELFKQTAILMGEIKARDESSSRRAETTEKVAFTAMSGQTAIKAILITVATALFGFTAWTTNTTHTDVSSLKADLTTNVSSLKVELNGRLDKSDQKVEARLDKLDQKIDALISKKTTTP